MSRSGSTISGGLIMGLPREDAARFAFMLSLPIVLGSGLKKLFELGVEGQFDLLGTSLLAGAAVAFIVGMLAIHYLLKYLRNHTLLVFVAYRIILAIAAFILL
jgi:undecaprenyl-diphosphatase